MLTKLHVQGYKALRDMSVTFEPLTVIVGPNGCGKSSLLEAVELVRDGVERTPKYASVPGALFSSGGGPNSEITLSVRAQREQRSGPVVPGAYDLHRFIVFMQEDGEFAFTLRHRRKGELAPLNATTYLGPSGVWLRHCISSIHRLSLDVSALAHPSPLSETRPSVKSDGSGLATVLNWLLGERDDRFAEIEEQLREFIPEVRRIRTKRVPMETVESVDVKVGTDKQGNDVFAKRSYQREETGHQVVIDYEHAEGVPAPHASEGTLLLLGLIATAVTTRASTILLDDVERGLHPKTQQHLVGYLSKLTQDGLQIIATSHSPYLLLHLDYDQVRAMTLAGAQGSQIGKLTEHPQFERWKEEMSPSEFWTVFGESWLEDRRASE